MPTMTAVERIVVVEDDRSIAEVVTRYLEREGYAVDTFHHGGEALDALLADPPDLVVLDLMLPGVDGPELFRRLRALAPVPVVILAARTGEGDRVQGLEMGAADYGAKPFAPREPDRERSNASRNLCSGRRGMLPRRR